MPLHNQINQDNKATVNPFNEHIPRVNEYTATEIATLQSRLDRQLGPEYISTRPGAGGGKVHYLAAEKVINLANEVFGFNGWSSAIQQVQIDFVDESPSTGKITLGLSIIVRVTLRDGTYHEDIGYGHIENCKGKAAAFEKAKKEAATDALKRALRNFGNVLGNCLYDKDYLQRVTKIKIAPSKWDAENLHRHPDFAPIKKESIEDADAQVRARVRMRSDHSARSAMTNGSNEFGEDEFGGNLFEEADFTHPDEVRLDDSATTDGDSTSQNGPASAAQTPRRSMDRNHSVPQQSNHRPQRPQSMGQPPLPASRAPETPRPGENPRPQPQGPAQAQRPPVQAAKPPGLSHGNAQRQPNPPMGGGGQGQAQAPDQGQAPVQEATIAPPPGMFVTGGALGKGRIEPFNPHAETTIRRTAGVNSGKSEPIMRTALNGDTPKAAAANGAADPGRPSAPVTRSNFVNPAADAHRRVGMPVAPQSPMANRSAYKPPSAVKRPAPTDGATRPPLAETTNTVQNEAAGGGGGEAKKAKIEPAAPVRVENGAAKA